jgi:3'(2'), 5'-bisphosphate nucleotidase
MDWPDMVSAPLRGEITTKAGESRDMPDRGVIHRTRPTAKKRPRSGQTATGGGLNFGSAMAMADSATAGVSALLEPLTEIVAKAAAAIRAMPANTVARRTKSDDTPVTAADDASERIILAALAALAPSIPVVSEELMTRQAPPPLGDRFFVVDPLDGTRVFVAGRDSYAVNLALVAQGRPVLGIVASPARNLLWRGIVGQGAERMTIDNNALGGAETIRTRPWPGAEAVAAISHSHLDAGTEDFLARMRLTQRRPMGSALKFCLIAEGNADVYPRFSRTCEWDVAAGHALVVAAGGTVTATDGTPLIYGGSDGHFGVPGFIAWGDPERAAG